jgi:hypothetical protein
MVTGLSEFLNDKAAVSEVERSWNALSERFEIAASRKPVPFMEREELSFHPFVKFLGFLAIDLRNTVGDIVEIGVWKGKSLAFMRCLADPGCQVIGIDPCELPGQSDELEYFRREVFPDCHVIKRYSQEAAEDTVNISRSFKILHIDGGHARHNVWTDFLLYERFVAPGGYIVFDDYVDPCSPEVGPAVDALNDAGLFGGYDIIGQPPGYESIFVLRKRR